MKPRWTRVAIAVLSAVAIVALAALVIRGGLRYYALNKVLRLPGAQARLALKPVTRSLTQHAPVHLVNLGYATFDTGTTNTLFIESISSGTAVMLTNSDVQLGILPPYAPDPPGFAALTNGFDQVARAHPHTLARLMEWHADEMSAEMAWEETQPLPPLRILFMSSDDFLLYSLKVGFKAGDRAGSNGVQFFRTPDVRGIVRIGLTTNDSRNVLVFLSSLDGTKNVGLRVWMAAPSAPDLWACLDPILRSFRFTVGRVDDQEKIKALIRAAGIQHRKQAPAEE